MKPMKILSLSLFLALPAARSAQGDQLAELLAKVQDEKNADVRQEARALAPQVGAPAVVPLGELLTDSRREVALTARAALERLVHHAGRPGAGPERGPVAAELARLLERGRPAAVKREAVHLISSIGADSSVPPVAALLDDPDAKVAEAARLSLERIPGGAALTALLEAAKKAPAARKPDLIYSLSKKGDRSVAPSLLEFASSAEAEVKFAAFEALGRLGAPEGLSALNAALAKAEEADRPRIYNELLRLADKLKETDRAAAVAVFRRAAAEAPLDYQREMGLGAACPAGSREGLPLLIAGLSDASPRVRRLAGARVRDLQGPEILQALQAGFESGKGSARPLILRAIAERDAAAAKPLLDKAKSDADVELKIIALDLLDGLDDPALEAVYLRAAESGSEWLRPSALKGYLILARRKVEKDAKAEALPMFERALDLAGEGGQRLEALKGIIAVSDPRSISKLEGLLKDSQLGTEAAQGYIRLAAAIGKGGDKTQAEKRLMAVVFGEFARDLKQKAGEELKGLGIDPHGKARAEGFVVDWWVVTPMRDEDGKRLERKDFPEEVIELDKEHREGPRRFRWQKVEQPAVDGRIDLLPLFRRSEQVVTYAYTEIESAGAREVLFKMGSDDGIACWLNGERIHLKSGSRSLKVDDDSVNARLTPGKNKVLLKISQKDGDWAFMFRVTDRDGKPLAPGALAGKSG